VSFDNRNKNRFLISGRQVLRDDQGRQKVSDGLPFCRQQLLNIRDPYGRYDVPQRKRFPLGLISLPDLDILVDPETGTFFELADREGTMWIDLIGRKSRRLFKKDMDEFYRRAHERGLISDQRFQELVDAWKGIPMPTIQQYKKMTFDMPKRKPPANPFPREGKSRPN
jgi:hypothetical protein